MIKYNEKYIINNGSNAVVFNEGKKGTVTGTHNEGTITGILEGNVLKATFHNSKVNAVGLIEITFHENGFDAKWKQGLEPGPMKGKWKGALLGVESEKPSKNVIIEIFGRGGEVVVGDVSDYENNLDNAFDETDMDLDEIILEDDIRIQFNLPEWNEIDNLLHVSGPFIDNPDDCIIKVSIDDFEIINSTPSDLLNSNGDQILELEECYFETDENKIFTGVFNEKGCLFSGFINLGENEEFDIDHLRLYSKEIMVNDENIALCIYKIEYKGEEVFNSDFYTDGRGIKLQLHS